MTAAAGRHNVEGDLKSTDPMGTTMNTTTRTSDHTTGRITRRTFFRAIASCGLAAAAATGLVFAPAVADTAPAAEAKRVATVDSDTCRNGDWGMTTTGTGHLDYCFNYRAWVANSTTDIVLSKDLRESDKNWVRSFSHSKGNSNRHHFRELGYVLNDSRNNWEAGDSCPAAEIRGSVIEKFDAISADGAYLHCTAGRLATSK